MKSEKLEPVSSLRARQLDTELRRQRWRDVTHVDGAETAARAGDARQAQEAATRALARAETLGLREFTARAEYVLATVMRLGNDPQARRRYASALQQLEEMAREEGNDRLFDRADLKTIREECVVRSRA